VFIDLVYGAGIALMLVSGGVFAYGHFNGNPDYMTMAAQWGMGGAVVTIVFGISRFVRRWKDDPNTANERKSTQSG